MGDEAEYLYAQEDYCLNNLQRYRKDTSKAHHNNMYQCTSCKEYKPKSDFYKDKRVPCGVRSRCKKCYHKPTE